MPRIGHRVSSAPITGLESTHGELFLKLRNAQLELLRVATFQREQLGRERDDLLGKTLIFALKQQGGLSEDVGVSFVFEAHR